MKLFAKICLFLSAYIPLFVIIFFKNFCIYISIIVSVILIGFCMIVWYLILKYTKNQTTEEFSVMKYKNRIKDSLEYLIPYILAFFPLNFDQSTDLIAFFVLMFIILIVFINSELIYINPLLLLFGYIIYEVEVTKPYSSETNSREIMLILRSDEKIRRGKNISIMKIDEDIYLM